jgi:hypothetical protein
MSDRAQGSRLAELLVENQRLRARGTSPPEFAARLAKLQQWQAKRLATTYSDLHGAPRYRAAFEFFLNDLYGPQEFADRDADLLRVHKVMERLLPARARHALELAIELEVLSQGLDLAVTEALEPGPIDAQRYAAAYRRADRRDERERQIELIAVNGRYLDELVKRPIIHRLVHLARGPAHAAGFGALQEFLERGFDAFRTMDGAGEFLATVVERETRIMQRLFAGTPDPFAVERPPAASR